MTNLNSPMKSLRPSVHCVSYRNTRAINDGPSFASRDLPGMTESIGLTTKQTHQTETQNGAGSDDKS